MNNVFVLAAKIIYLLRLHDTQTFLDFAKQIGDSMLPNPITTIPIDSQNKQGVNRCFSTP